jgi:hypothetical protein
MGYDQLDEDAGQADALTAPAELAHALGVEVERFRVRSPRPIAALVELVSDLAPSVLVFGPDRGRLRPRIYRKALGAVRTGTTCLVWTVDDASS